MPRPSQLGKKRIGKHTYWKSQIGGKSYTFGNVEKVDRAKAEALFRDAIERGYGGILHIGLNGVERQLVETASGQLDADEWAKQLVLAAAAKAADN